MLTDYQTHLVYKSANSKTGPIPVTYTTAATCPVDCIFNHKNEGGCYAEQGHTAINWRLVTAKKRGDVFPATMQKIKDLPPGTLWRHNVAGDLPGDGEHLNGTACEQLTAANENKSGFTYTHYNPTKNGNGVIIKAMNAAGFTVNLSGNSVDHAIELSALNVGPVVAVTHSKKTGNFKQGGKSFVQCPATVKDSITCKTCKLCAVGNRKSIVYFPAHGSKSGVIDEILNKKEA